MISRKLTTNRYVRLIFVLALASISVLLLVSSSFGPDPGDGSQSDVPGSQDFVSSVVKAPIVPDGNVAGAPTDIVINLDRSLDPAVEGRSLLRGNQIRITLPDAFVNVRGWPGLTVFTPGCVPPNLQCNTGALIQGWPQHPLLPMFPPGSGPPVFYESSLEGNQTFVFTALQDVVPGLPAPGPGIKQIHLFALGFDNPKPGFYDIQVDAQTGPGGEWETGSARVQIYPNVRPSINVTSIYNGGAPNTIYQQTSPETVTPFLYDFLLWDSNGQPMDGVTVKMVNENHGQLNRGRSTVGQITIKAPKGATGQDVTIDQPSYIVNAPLLGVPAARLTTSFVAGSATGLYEVTFSLNNGNSATMFVEVN
jgi:hypothetical protein